MKTNPVLVFVCNFQEDQITVRVFDYPAVHAILVAVDELLFRDAKAQQALMKRKRPGGCSISVALPMVIPLSVCSPKNRRLPGTKT